MKTTIRLALASLMVSSFSHSVFADDLLTTYHYALKNDPATLRAKAQYMASKEGIEQARSVLYPQISAFASTSKATSEAFDTFTGNERIVSTDLDRTSYGASLNMQIYHHNTWLQLDNAKKVAHQSDIAYRLAKQDLILNVSQAYFDILRAQDDLTFSKALNHLI